jgi:hypothetical protein
MRQTHCASVHITDLANLCLVSAHIGRAMAINASGHQLGTWLPLTVHNVMGKKAVFMLTRKWAGENGSTAAHPN